MFVPPRLGASTLFAATLLALAACDGDDAGSSPADDGGAGTTAPALDAGGSGAGAKDAAAPDAGDQRAVQLRFAARFGAQAHACGATYGGQGTAETDVVLTSLKLYVHDVRLVTAEGEQVEVALDERGQWQIPEIALLDLAGRRECQPGTPANDVVTGRVRPGEYRGVAFTVGVPHAINHADPVTAKGPLQAPGMQWTWLTGYRFFIAEVQQVLSGDEDAALFDGADDADGGSAQARGAGVLHVGSVACSGSPVRGDVSCEHPNRNRVELDGFDPERDVIAVDLSALFEGNDLSVASTCHSAEPLCEPMFERFGLDWKTGEPLPSQRVFRVVPAAEDGL